MPDWIESGDPVIDALAYLRYLDNPALGECKITRPATLALLLPYLRKLTGEPSGFRPLHWDGRIRAPSRLLTACQPMMVLAYARSCEGSSQRRPGGPPEETA